MNLELLTNKLRKRIALAGLSLLGFGAAAQTNVTVDANATWISGMLCFMNNPAQSYEFYDPWSLEALKTTLNTTANTVTLQPNYNAYVAGDAYWANGDLGNKIMLALSYVQNDALIGQNFTFSGNATSYTLVPGYTVKAFVKVMNADYSAALDEDTQDITTTGNFTMAYNASSYPAGSHVQYGFQVRGLNANPAYEAAYGSVVITADEPEVVPPTGGSTVVTIDTSDTLNTYANWFLTDGTTYAGGDNWTLENLKTVVDAANERFILYPNFNTYEAGNAYWANGEIGNKIFEGNTYIEDNDLLSQNVTFVGHCITNTLASGYVARAFIKVLSGDYQLLNYTPVVLAADTDFSLNVDVNAIAGAAHVQYGYSVTGLNANPTQEAALGNAVVQGITAGTKQFDKKSIAVYPNPATDVLNISSHNDIISNIQVYNLIGQQVINLAPNATLATVNVSALKAGVYMVTTTVNGKTSTSKFIKQ